MPGGECTSCPAALPKHGRYDLLAQLESTSCFLKRSTSHRICTLGSFYSSVQAGKIQHAGTPCCPPPSPATLELQGMCHMQSATCSCTQASQAKVLKQRRVMLRCTPGIHLVVAPHWELRSLLQSRLPWGLGHQHAPGQPFPRLPEEAAGVSLPCQGWGAAAAASHAMAPRMLQGAFLHSWNAGGCVTSLALHAGATTRRNWVGNPQTTQSKEASSRTSNPGSMCCWGASASCADSLRMCLCARVTQK